MVSDETGEMSYMHWKLIVSALFIAAAWLALAPTAQTWEGGTGPGSNCGVPLFNAGESAFSADGCTYANRVRLQQSLMTALPAAAIGGLYLYLRRVHEADRREAMELEARRAKARANRASAEREREEQAAREVAGHSEPS